MKIATSAVSYLSLAFASFSFASARLNNPGENQQAMEEAPNKERELAASLIKNAGENFAENVAIGASYVAAAETTDAQWTWSDSNPFKDSDFVENIVKKSAHLSQGVYFGSSIVVDFDSAPSKYTFDSTDDPSHPGHEFGVVASHQNYCYASFRGLDLKCNILDFSSNWDPSCDVAGELIQALGDMFQSSSRWRGGCKWERAFTDIFDGLMDKGMRDDIHSCMSTCKNTYGSADGDCHLAINGHSQGGAVAMIAAAVFAEYNPWTITFGAPPAMWTSSCSSLDPTHIYRFINVQDLAGTFVELDSIPAYNTEKAYHLGRAVVIGSDKRKVRYYPDNGHASRSNKVSRIPQLSHPMGKYEDNIDNWGSTLNGFGGFGGGEHCTTNSHCDEGACLLGYCLSQGGNGDFCLNDSWCDSKFCNFGVCDRKVANGQACGLHSACESGFCNIVVCDSKKKNGTPCSSNNVCKSGKCTVVCHA